MKVVVLCDSSPVSLNALKFYLVNYHQPMNEVHCFHAVLPPVIPSLDLAPSNYTSAKIMAIVTNHNTKEVALECEVERIYQRYRQDNWKQQELVKIWQDVDKTGEIAETAMKYINRIDAKLVITGTRNLSGMKKAWVGSVSDYILKRCHCPVVIHKSIMECPQTKADLARYRKMNEKNEELFMARKGSSGDEDKPRRTNSVPIGPGPFQYRYQTLSTANIVNNQNIRNASISFNDAMPKNAFGNEFDMLTNISGRKSSSEPNNSKDSSGNRSRKSSFRKNSKKEKNQKESKTEQVNVMTALRPKLKSESERHSEKSNDGHFQNLKIGRESKSLNDKRCGPEINLNGSMNLLEIKSELKFSNVSKS